MPINIKLVNSAFHKQVTSRHWASQTNQVFYMGTTLFEQLISDKSKEEQKKFYTILLGTIAVVIAEEMRDCGFTHNILFSKDKDAELTWNSLYQKCDIEKIKALHRKDDPRLQGWTTHNVIYRNTILRAGEKILNQEIPFDLVRMNKVFPELAPLFAEINAQYPLVPVVKAPSKSDQVLGKLELIQAAILSAQQEYAKWYKGESSSDVRSQIKEGFFSRLRHGNKGQVVAQKLVATLSSCHTEQEAIDAVNNFFNELGHQIS